MNLGKQWVVLARATGMHAETTESGSAQTAPVHRMLFDR